MNPEQPTSPSPGLLKRLPAPVFWLFAVLVGLVSATVLLLIAGLTAEAIAPSTYAAALSALAGALVGFIAPIFYLKARRGGPKLPKAPKEPPASMAAPELERTHSQAPSLIKPPQADRRRLIDGLVDHNFKTTNGITRFFKYGIGSGGIVVDENQELELRRICRRFYYLIGGTLFIGNILIGPFLSALLAPALILGFIINTNDVTAPPFAPDRITFTESFRRRAMFLPLWIIRATIIISIVAVVGGFGLFINEVLTARRLERIGIEYDDSLFGIYSIIFFFSFGITMMFTALSVRRRHTNTTTG
jgi:hypothetical protein